MHPEDAPITGARNVLQARLTKSLTLLLSICVLAACGGGGGGGGSSSAAPVASQNTSNPGTVPTTPATPGNPLPSTTEIKLLALYSQGVEEQFTDADLRITHLTNVANDILSQSGLDITFEVVHSALVDYPEGNEIETALEDLTNTSHPSFAQVPSWRNIFAADLVVLLRPYANDGRCGYAWIGGYQANGLFNAAQADYGFSVVSSNCSDYTFLHELGHNMGLAHSRRQAPKGGTFPYAAGHGVDGEFVTIMATSGEFSAPRLPLLSSPQLDCNGFPCGVSHLNSNGADSVTTLRHTASQVARYR